MASIREAIKPVLIDFYDQVDPLSLSMHLKDRLTNFNMRKIADLVRVEPDQIVKMSTFIDIINGKVSVAQLINALHRENLDYLANALENYMRLTGVNAESNLRSKVNISCIMAYFQIGDGTNTINTVGGQLTVAQLIDALRMENLDAEANEVEYFMKLILAKAESYLRSNGRVNSGSNVDANVGANTLSSATVSATPSVLSSSASLPLDFETSATRPTSVSTCGPSTASIEPHSSSASTGLRDASSCSQSFSRVPSDLNRLISVLNGMGATSDEERRDTEEHCQRDEISTDRNFHVYISSGELHVQMGGGTNTINTLGEQSDEEEPVDTAHFLSDNSGENPSDNLWDNSSDNIEIVVDKVAAERIYGTGSLWHNLSDNIEIVVDKVAAGQTSGDITHDTELGSRGLQDDTDLNQTNLESGSDGILESNLNRTSTGKRPHGIQDDSSLPNDVSDIFLQTVEMEAVINEINSPKLSVNNRTAVSLNSVYENAAIETLTNGREIKFQTTTTSTNKIEAALAKAIQNAAAVEQILPAYHSVAAADVNMMSSISNEAADRMLIEAY